MRLISRIFTVTRYWRVQRPAPSVGSFDWVGGSIALRCIVIATLLLAQVELYAAAQPADTSPSHSLVYVEHDIPGIYHGELRAADLNGDGKPDLVLYGVVDSSVELWGPTEDGKASARVMVYFNACEPGRFKFNAGPVWQPGDGKCPWLDEHWRGGLQTFDYDGDGDTDFVISGKGLIVFTNDGKGNFTPARISQDGGHLAVGDFNGDHHDDVMHTRSYYGKGNAFYFSFDGDGWQPCGFHFDHIMGAGDLVVGDLDGDDWADIVVGGNTEQFGSHRASTKCFSQWHRNQKGRIEAEPAFFFSTLGREQQHNTEHDGMDNGSYDLTDLNGDGHLDLVFSGSHAGFEGDRNRPYWSTPENPDGGRKWIHYDFFTLIQQPPFDGRHWKSWEFNGGGAGCKTTSCVAAADTTGDGCPEVVHIGHTSQRLLPPPYDLPRRRADGFEGARRWPNGGNYYHAKYTATIRVFENDGRGGLRFVHHDTLIPVDYGDVIWVDLDRDGRKDLVYC
ncbi:MAG: FG-GAP-like repeat-containing protein, partial [Planctomycetes bacterium]|nr:FG-GAP-like repeat-containing protein [Planctomycetota bacterium]